MNKAAIKSFAVSARIKLMEDIMQKAYELGITEHEIKEPEIYQDGFRINDRFFKQYQIKQRDRLLQKIKQKSYEQVIEEVAYTWFNRLIAIRFMEVNEYLPTGVRVLSSIDEGKKEPDAASGVLEVAEDLELNLELVYRLQDENDTEDLFKYILVKQCNKLGEIMPMIFEEIEDYTELLLPDNLLAEGTVVRDLVSMIDEEDWKEQVEIIGWLYQYYISEKKDKVFADLKKNKKITKENIPAATQLFTPKWIVQYMVENSLGKLWLETHPNEELKQQWKYFLEEAEQGSVVQEQLEKIRNKELNPEEIKILDPCMGSGHILVYAFDVLYSIYQSAGYSEREIPQLILEKNLYGLDIDDRAAQLAYFALIMKARSYNRRVFRKKIKMNICSIQESNDISKEAIEFFFDNGINENITRQSKEIDHLLKAFKDAKEYGAIIDVSTLNINEIESILDKIRNNDNIEDIFNLQYRDIILERLPLLVEQAKIMKNKYDITITNPPYVGNKGMSNNLSKYVKDNYPNSKYDLFSVFIEKCLDFTTENGLTSMITMESWMFLSRFENLRKKLISNTTILNLVHMPYEGRGRTSLGINFGTVSFTTRKMNSSKFLGCYSCVRYMDIDNEGVPFTFPVNNNRLGYSPMERYKSIPGIPFAYWASGAIEKAFGENSKIGDFGEAREGMATANNDYFLKLWTEVSYENIGFNYSNREEAKQSLKKWVPYNKGGKYRRWYGNNHYVVNWFNDGDEIRNFKDKKTGRIRSHNYNLDYIFKEGITWSSLTSSVFSCRYSENGRLSDSKGPTLYINELNYLKYIFGFMNTKVAQTFLDLTAPTMDYKVGDIAELPIIESEYKVKVDNIVDECISIAKNEWDLYETSWGFKENPLLKHKDRSNLLQHSFNSFKKFINDQFNKLKFNEEELNRIFIEVYGLKDEITPEIKDYEVSIREVNMESEVKGFVSFAVGCLFGRYSLDHDGLVFAGGEFDKSKYVMFKTAPDNILPITEVEYFEDDIVSRLIEFVKVTFGEDTLEENLNFIAEGLTKKTSETSRQRIRRYFLKEFFKDHSQTYQKRPVYWQFDSGKNDGFKALIYLHRYDAGTVPRIRTDYLHTLQRKYEAEISRQDMILESDISTTEKTKAKKQKEKLQKQLLECQQYDQVIAHVANQKVEIELDDGVKVNYDKFQNIEVPQGEGKNPLKANLLTKI